MPKIVHINNNNIKPNNPTSKILIPMKPSSGVILIGASGEYFCRSENGLLTLNS
jgi:hypothetical protein